MWKQAIQLIWTDLNWVTYNHPLHDGTDYRCIFKSICISSHIVRTEKRSYFRVLFIKAISQGNIFAIFLFSLLYSFLLQHDNVSCNQLPTKLIHPRTLISFRNNNCFWMLQVVCSWWQAHEWKCIHIILFEFSFFPLHFVHIILESY